jgi:SAM-dependent methyltransferase
MSKDDRDDPSSGEETSHLESSEALPEPLFFDLEAGTTEFYEDTQYYDYEFKARREDVRFYTEQYTLVDGWALEIGVGTARIAAPAVRAGAKVIGLDLHEGMLKAAEIRRQRLPKSKRGHLRLIQGDMRSFELGEQFSLITCPFNALQHMYTNEDFGRCMERIKHHLAPGGLFLFDVLLPDVEYLSRPPYQRHAGVHFKHPTWGAVYQYSEQTAYDPARQLNHVWLHYDRVDPAIGEPCDAPEYHCIQLSHRCFFPLEIEMLLSHHGFEVISRFGDFEGEPICDGAESMIFFCQRSSEAHTAG